MVLKSQHLSPNLHVRQQVQEWLAAHPSASVELPHLAEPERADAARKSAGLFPASATPSFARTAEPLRFRPSAVGPTFGGMDFLSGLPDLNDLLNSASSDMITIDPPPSPSQLVGDLPVLFFLYLIAFLFVLYSYNLATAVLLAVAFLFQTLPLYSDLHPPPGYEALGVMGFTFVFGLMGLALLLAARCVQSLASWLVWGTPRMEMPWRFIGAWAFCLAALCRERWCLGGLLADSWRRPRRRRMPAIW